MGFPRTHLSAATAVADPDRFVILANGAMKNGAYTLEATKTMPEAGTARHITLTHATVAAGTDTLGTVTVVTRSLSGQFESEVLTPVADSLVTGTKWAMELVSVTGADTAAVGGTDTITVGCAADSIIAEAGVGTLHAVAVNTTAAGTITFADASGTIAVLKSSIAEHNYCYDAKFTGYLKVTLLAASDITVMHSGSMPNNYA